MEIPVGTFKALMSPKLFTATINTDDKSEFTIKSVSFKKRLVTVTKFYFDDDFHKLSKATSLRINLFDREDKVTSTISYALRFEDIIFNLDWEDENSEMFQKFGLQMTNDQILTISARYSYDLMRKI